MKSITRRETCIGVLSVAAITTLPERIAYGQRVIEGARGVFRALGGLEDLRTDKSYHMVAGLNADGSVAVGQSELGGKAVAYVWSDRNGMMPLSRSSSIAWGISGDGSTIVGRSEAQGGEYATIWETASGVSFAEEQEAWAGIVEERVRDNSIELQSAHFGEFNAISPDGRMLAGQTESTKGRHGFWMGSLEEARNVTFSEKLVERAPESAIYAVTDEVSGLRYAATGTFGGEQEDGHCLTLRSMEEIACNTMQNRGFRAIDCAIAPFPQEGKLVSVGGSSTWASGGEYIPVLRELENTGRDQIGAITMELGALPGGDGAGLANVISQDGGMIAGNASIGVYKKKEWRPFVWDTKNGMRDLQKLAVEEYGMNVENWDLRSATAISEDGMIIGGWGYDPIGQPEPWIMTLK